MTTYPPEPFRIKMVETIHLISPDARRKAISKTGYNLFSLRAEDIFIDLLTDSGTGAMSDKQWAAIMQGDESYAGARSYFTLADAVNDIFGFSYFVPTHQGRAAENILSAVLVTPGKSIPSNMHFDTTEANICARGGKPVNLLIDEGFDTQSKYPFKGNLDVQKLESFIQQTDPKNIPFGMITITNNAGGGQPVSLENIKQVSRTYHKYGIPFYIDAARYAENCYFIKLREKGYENVPLQKIAAEIFSHADGFCFSAKKDAIVNIGGLLATKDKDTFQRIKNELILREGFPTYGGLAGRDLEAMAVGLYEGLDEAYLTYRIKQTSYLGECLRENGIQIVEPPGGHAIFIDAGALLPHIPHHEFPGQALSIELYLEGGIRSCEIGSVMFSHPDPESGTMHYPKLELVRLAIPRRTYTQSHMDYVAEITGKITKKAKSMRGYQFTYAPELLRHFTAKFKPL
jgi:tryptophanase